MSAMQPQSFSQVSNCGSDSGSEIFYDAVEQLSDISTSPSEDWANNGILHVDGFIRSPECLLTEAHHRSKHVDIQSVMGYGAPLVSEDIGYCFSISLWLNGCQTLDCEDEETISDVFVDASSTLWWDIMQDHEFFSSKEDSVTCNESTEKEDDSATDDEHHTKPQISGHTSETEPYLGRLEDDLEPNTTPVKICPSVDSGRSTHSDVVIAVSQNLNESTAVFTQILSAVAVKDQTLEPLEDIFPAEEECSSTHPKDHAMLNKIIPIEEIQTGETRLRDVEEQLPAQQDKEDTQKGAPVTEEHCSVMTSEKDGSLDQLCTVDSKKVCGSDMTGVPPSGHSGSTSQKTSQKVGVNEAVRENIKCAPLLFKTDFLSDKYFGENQPASIVTEEDHFGEGMHRRVFRTKLLVGLPSLFNPGHPCVLKVHNAICYGTKTKEELICKNYNLAVEECYAQNIAREYIKAYTEDARSSAVFGEVPEIIPIYLVHRPSSGLPYATLEEELVGDFVKYSVRDGKEINLMRRDSEAGQKCCTFQHWVFHKTEGNLLVTDMQGVGMKLTDVGIATCTKGYRGFRGNCATSFIDQFKALHQCNKFCVLLGLKSLQASPKKLKRTATEPKTNQKPQPKKKAPTPNNKSQS